MCVCGKALTMSRRCSSSSRVDARVARAALSTSSRSAAARRALCLRRLGRVLHADARAIGRLLAVGGVMHRHGEHRTLRNLQSGRRLIHADRLPGAYRSATRPDRASARDRFRPALCPASARPRAASCLVRMRTAGGPRAPCPAGAAGRGSVGSPRMYTMTWCTTAGLPGRTSTAWTHLSSVRLVGISKNL